jgi:hypothetical protein
MQFEQKNQSEFMPQNGDRIIPAVLISQLIGLSVGLEDEEIGIGGENCRKLLAHAGVI